jgi:hypothetical protein
MTRSFLATRLAGRANSGRIANPRRVSRHSIISMTISVETKAIIFAIMVTNVLVNAL